MQIDSAARPAAPDDRAGLRSRLRAARDGFVAGPEFDAAGAALAGHLASVLAQLEPRCLGLYWPIRGEFNAAAACREIAGSSTIDWALPFTLRDGRQMHYRHWDRQPPALRDESGLPASSGAPAEPDVVLVPCLGYTDDGYRLGYGAGYFDRWLGAHPQVTALGVAWRVGRMWPDQFTPRAHDRPVLLVVTEAGIVG